MPINDYACRTCGTVSEIITRGPGETPLCKSCGGTDLARLLSAHNVGRSSRSHREPSGGGCCGSPNSCDNPGSCCSG